MIDGKKIVNEIKKRLTSMGFKGVVTRCFKECGNTYFIDRVINGETFIALADYCGDTKDLCVYAPDSATPYNTRIESKIYNLSDPEFFEKCVDRIIKVYS